MNPFRPLRLRALAAALVLGLATAIATTLAPPALAADSDQDEEAADFKDAITSDTATIDRMIADTRAGKNISDFRLGMFSMNLLNELGDRDAGLGGYFHKDGRTMQSYLTDVFQYHDAEEVARVAVLAQAPKAEGVRPMVRLSAKDALEALRHIPDGKDPPESQAKDREDLAAALATLKGDLAKAVQE